MRAHGLPVPEFAVFRRNDAIRLEFSGAERFAVRSTFDAEDSAAHSFAGQFDTLLNVARARDEQAHADAVSAVKHETAQTAKQARAELREAELREREQLEAKAPELAEALAEALLRADAD